MHKKSDITMSKWEQHFNKLQHGLTFDKNNPGVTDTFEDKNCYKKLIQDDASPSQNKSYDKHKTHSLDECVKNTVEKLLAVPRHLNIDKKKTLDVQPETQKFPQGKFNTAEPQTKCQSFCLCSHEDIWDSDEKMLFNWECGKNVSIAKDIMNYV